MKEILRKFRRELHQIPEPAFEEKNTAKYIRQKLSEHNIPYEEIKTEYYDTGTLVYFKGEKGCIAFRSDIDGLPIVEENKCEFISKNKNCHACGHDGHAATLLTFAIWLKNLQESGKKFKKSIVLIFQPGEEGKGGARYLSKHPSYLNKHIEAIFGMHLSPLFPQGTIASKPGPVMAQTINLDIKVTGHGTHGAQPQNGIDTILATSRLIDAYQSVVSRNISPFENVVVTIGSIHGGVTRNIIPETVSLLGTVRLFNKDIIPKIEKRMSDINRGFEISYGVKIDFGFTPVYSPVVNDPVLFEKFKLAVDPDKLIICTPQMIAEDFSFYLQDTPGVFFFLGVRNEEKGFTQPLHNPKFNFDEDALLLGLQTFENICNIMEVF